MGGSQSQDGATPAPRASTGRPATAGEMVKLNVYSPSGSQHVATSLRHEPWAFSRSRFDRDTTIDAARLLRHTTRVSRSMVASTFSEVATPLSAASPCRGPRCLHKAAAGPSTRRWTSLPAGCHATMLCGRSRCGDAAGFAKACQGLRINFN